MCDPFHHLVFKLSRMLSKEDEDALAYVYRLPADIVSPGSGSNGLPYFMELEKRDIFSPSNLSGIKEILNVIQRCDLIEMVEQYEKKFSNGNQGYRRPQEERTRLEKIYTQATNIEVQLSEFQREFTALCSKFRESSSMMQLYTGMVKRLHDMREDCHGKITIPLFKVINFVQPCLEPVHAGETARHKPVPQPSQHGNNWSSLIQKLVAPSTPVSGQTPGKTEQNQRKIEIVAERQWTQPTSQTTKDSHRSTTQWQPSPQRNTSHRTPDSTRRNIRGRDFDLSAPIVFLSGEQACAERDTGSAKGEKYYSTKDRRRNKDRGGSSSPSHHKRELNGSSGRLCAADKREHNLSTHSLGVCTTSTPAYSPAASVMKKTKSVDDILSSSESRIPKSSSRLYRLIGMRISQRCPSEFEGSSSSDSSNLSCESRAGNSCGVE